MIKRGASLVWTVIVCSVLMVVATTMSTVIVKESQMSVRMDDSARAYAAAESGISWAKQCLSDYTVGGCFAAVKSALWDADKNAIVGAVYSLAEPIKLGDTHYQIKIETSCSLLDIQNNICDSPYTITSTGSSGSVNRAIEYKTSRNASDIAFGYNASGGFENNLSDDLNITGSFSSTFDYWQSVSSTLDGDKFVFKGPTGDEVGVKLLVSSFDLYSTIGGIASTTAVIPYPDGFIPTNPFSTKVNIKYVAGVAARVDVYGLTSGGSRYLCLGSKTISFDNDVPVFGPNSHFVLEPANGEVVTSTVETLNTINVNKYTVGGLRTGYIANMIWSGVEATAVLPPSDWITSVNVPGIEVYKIDSPIKNNWTDSGSACALLATGSRLPTFEELNDIYDNRTDFGVFQSSTNYWSSKESLVKVGYAYFVNMITGATGTSDKSTKYYYRCVRTKP